MRKKAVFNPRICACCSKEYIPSGASQQYCIDCSQTRDKERKAKWYQEHYQYSTRPKKCLEKCCVCGGEFLAHKDGKPYCRLHYSRLRRHGTVEQTRGNTYEIDGNVFKIFTYKKELIIADLEDAEKLKRYSWCISKTGYPVARINHKTTKLHRYLLDITDPKIVIDHINHNPLDNRRCNIRICTNRQNALNHSGRKGRNLPVGITITDSGKYLAYITVNRKNIYLGRFLNIEDAINVRQKAEIEYRGEFAQHLYKDKGLDDSEKYYT